MDVHIFHRTIRRKNDTGIYTLNYLSNKQRYKETSFDFIYYFKEFTVTAIDGDIGINDDIIYYIRSEECE